MLFHAISSRSVRESSALLNRIRHQEDTRVANSTLRDFEERKGMEIADALQHSVAQQLKAPGLPLPKSPKPLSEIAVEESLREANVPPELLAEAKDNPVPYSDPEATCDVSADAVFCKKQKESRKDDAPPPKK